MSELQLYLLAGGAVFVVLVLVYNVVTERRARKRAERAFGEAPGDALFDAPRPKAAAGERREPVIGAMPDMPAPVAASLDETPERVAPEELEAPGGPSAEISSRIDTVAVILADDPVMAEQLEPLLNALQSHTTSVRVEGIVDEQWHPIETSPKRSWRELRAGLQLASRSGPVSEDEIERFNVAIADFAGSLGAVSQREAASVASARGRELDRFCADADIEIAVNVIGQFGATFAVAKVKALALDNGFSETASGDLVRFAADGAATFAIRRFEDPTHKAQAAYYPGLTFALDLPHVQDPVHAFNEMAHVAQGFSGALGGQMVDDNRKPLTDMGLAAIRRMVEKIAREMESNGVPAGSALARRLFA
jgi:hypothetical protein